MRGSRSSDLRRCFLFRAPRQRNQRHACRSCAISPVKYDVLPLGPNICMSPSLIELARPRDKRIGCLLRGVKAFGGCVEPAAVVAVSVAGLLGSEKKRHGQTYRKATDRRNPKNFGQISIRRCPFHFCSPRSNSRRLSPPPPRPPPPPRAPMLEAPRLLLARALDPLKPPPDRRRRRKRPGFRHHSRRVKRSRLPIASAPLSDRLPGPIACARPTGAIADHRHPARTIAPACTAGAIARLDCHPAAQPVAVHQLGDCRRNLREPRHQTGPL